MENIDQRGIYTDLVRELAHKGANVFIVAPREKRTNLPTVIVENNNIHVLKVKTGNITKTNFVEKGISTLSIEGQYLRAINKYFGEIHFDMILYSTPPITFEKVVKFLKRKHHSKTYLILKDIFPQNAVDLGLLKKDSLIWRYFRSKEKRLYELSDYIGCMSKANVRYILEHNASYIDKSKVEVFPNSIRPITRIASKNNSEFLLEKYNIPDQVILFVYGGNLGIPQGIDFLLEVIREFRRVKGAYLLIVGSGTEYTKVSSYIEDLKPYNVGLLPMLPKDEYDQLLESAHVGLIFLDKRFTIPNFPSRLTVYMEYSLPILAATDENTDLKDIIQESKSGFWSVSGDLEAFINNAKVLTTQSDLRERMGANGRQYLEENYDIRKTVDVILKHL